MYKDSKQPTKLPYKAPKLRTYGDLGQMTQSGGSMGMVLDGGVPGMSKTG